MRAKATSGFVYLWRDAKRRKFYLGSHWGSPDDGYISGSKRMYKAYRARPETFKRRIIAIVTTTRSDLHREEQRWLDMIADADLSARYYNVKKFAVGADPVAASLRMKGNKHGAGKPCPPERRGRIAFAQIDKYIPPETRAKMSVAKRDKPMAEALYQALIPIWASKKDKKRPPEIGRKISAKKMGHDVSQETRAKISKSKLAWFAAQPPKPPVLKDWELSDVPQTIWYRPQKTGRRAPRHENLSRKWGAVVISDGIWRYWYKTKPERIIAKYIPLGLPI